MSTEFIPCPRCGNATRTKARPDTVLKNFPIYCAKCKTEHLVNYENGILNVIQEPDA